MLIVCASVIYTQPNPRRDSNLNPFVPDSQPENLKTTQTLLTIETASSNLFS